MARPIVIEHLLEEKSTKRRFLQRLCAYFWNLPLGHRKLEELPVALYRLVELARESAARGVGVHRIGGGSRGGGGSTPSTSIHSKTPSDGMQDSAVDGIEALGMLEVTTGR